MHLNILGDFPAGSADVCPPGSYCPQGTDEPIECPEGTYNPDSGRMSVSDCLNCTGGYYCDATGKNLTMCDSGSVSTY